MIKKLLFGLISIWALGLTAFSSCAIAEQDRSEAFIQSKWRLQGETPSKDGYAKAWFLEWTFTNGKFLQTGYPPIRQEGKYRIVKQEGNKLTLDLYEQKGNFGTKDQQIEIIIDRKNEKLKIQSHEGFRRTGINR